MTDIREFITAALDEAQWFAEELKRSTGGHVPFAVSRGRGQWSCTDADRLLAEVAAKRRILERHEPHRYRVGRREIGTPDCGWCSYDGADWDETATVAWPCPDVLDLAAPLRGRDGWDPSWEAT